MGRTTGSCYSEGKRKRIKGYHKLRTTQGRKPYWFNVPDLKPTQIIPNRFISERHFNSLSLGPILAGDACALVYPKKVEPIKLWLYMNSTIFYLTEELHGMRMGAAALQILAGEYEDISCFDLNIINKNLNFNLLSLLDREVLKIEEEIKNEKRRQLDIIILNSLGYDAKNMLENLYNSMMEVVEDRLIKAKHGLKQIEEEEM